MCLHPFDNIVISFFGPCCIILSVIEERIIACCNFFLKKKPHINGIAFSQLPNYNFTDYDADIEYNKVETEDNQTEEERDTQHKCLSSKIQHRANNLIEMVAGKKDNAILEQLQII
jgi:hypothetical protein